MKSTPRSTAPSSIRQSAKRWLHRAGLLGWVRARRVEWDRRRLVRARRLALARPAPGKVDVIRDGDVMRVKDDEYSVGLALSEFNYWFSQVVPEVQDCSRLVDYSEPRLHTLMQTRLQFWFPSIADGEIPVAGYVSDYRPREGDIVFDGGAYCGIASYFFAKLVGQRGRVFAFEPEAGNAELLERNLRLHNLANVRIIRKGLWSRSGALQFESRADIGTGFLQDQSRPSRELPVLSIPDACAEFGLRAPTLVKMDIEGAEIEAVEGCRGWVEDKDVHFAIASYHRRNGEPTSVALETMFAEYGYEVRTGYPPHRTTWAGRRGAVQSCW